MPLLHPGDTFPELSLTVPGRRNRDGPEAFAGQFGVLLFYRGSWCPYCNPQLRAFQRAGGALADAGVRVAALSVDDETATAALIAKHGLTFPVGYGADARKVADLTGAFVNPDPVYLQSTGFVTRPAGQGRGQRLLQRGHRPARARRRGRARPLCPRAHPGLDLRTVESGRPEQSAAPVRGDDFDFFRTDAADPGDDTVRSG